MEFLSNITVRARVAFYLAIAEKVFTGVKKDDDGFLIGREALDQCWNWLEGQDITGYDLHEYLENERDESIMVISCDAKDDQIKNPIWLTVTTSLMYTIWKAYIMGREKHIPQTINEVDETIVNELIEFSSECQNFNKTWIEFLRIYLLEKYKTDNADEFGNPIQRNEVMGVIEGA